MSDEQQQARALFMGAGLAKLREPFAEKHISKLPKPTRAQTDAVKEDFRQGIRCKVCGSWHHPEVVHLDYVGHAALTHRLLDADPQWSWEPVAFRDGLPAFDASGGLWIRLTVCGTSRLGYGNAEAKPNTDKGAREKEVIGDALRNAAMRFGAALDLWHKGDLHGDDPPPPPELRSPLLPPTQGIMPESELLDWKASIDSAATVGDFKRVVAEAEAACNSYGDHEAMASVQASAIAKAAKAKKP